MLSISILGKMKFYTLHSFGVFNEKAWGKKLIESL